MLQLQTLTPRPQTPDPRAPKLQRRHPPPHTPNPKLQTPEPQTPHPRTPSPTAVQVLLDEASNLDRQFFTGSLLVRIHLIIEMILVNGPRPMGFRIHFCR